MSEIIVFKAIQEKTVMAKILQKKCSEKNNRFFLLIRDVNV